MLSGSLLGLFFPLGLLGVGGLWLMMGSLINGILYVVATGCRWRDIPSRYGSYVTAMGYDFTFSGLL